MSNYVKSNLIGVFPAGFRDAANAKSKLTTEENLTGLNLLSSDSNIRNRWFEVGDKTVILIEGYKFVIETKNIPDATDKEGNTLKDEKGNVLKVNYACIKLGDLGGTDSEGNTDGTAKIKVLMPWDGTAAGAILDSEDNFTGLYFTDTKPSGTNVFYAENGKNFAITSSEVLNADKNNSINKQFNTEDMAASSQITTPNINGINVTNKLNTGQETGLLIENIVDKEKETFTRISLGKGKIIAIDDNSAVTLDKVTITPGEGKNTISMSDDKNNVTFTLPNNCTDEGDHALVQNNSDAPINKWVKIDVGTTTKGSGAQKDAYSCEGNTLVQRDESGGIIASDIYVADNIIALKDITGTNLYAETLELQGSGDSKASATIDGKINNIDLNIVEVKKDKKDVTTLQIKTERDATNPNTGNYGLGIEKPAYLGVTEDGSILTDIDNKDNTNTLYIGAGTYINPVFEDATNTKPKGTRIGHVTEATEEGKDNVLNLPFNNTNAEAVLAQTNSEPKWIPTTTSAKNNTDASKIVKTGEDGKIDGVAYPHDLSITIESDDSDFNSITKTTNIGDGENKHITLDINLLQYHNRQVTAGFENNAGNKTLHLPQLAVNRKGVVVEITDKEVDYKDTFNEVKIKSTSMAEERKYKPVSTFYIPLCVGNEGNKTLLMTENIRISDGANILMLDDLSLEIKANNTYSGANAINTSGNITCGKLYLTSDKRLKENLREFKPKKSILELPIYKYDLIKGEKDQIGCLAQDLKEICPEIVKEDKDGYLSIQESKLVYLLLDEVKKLKAEIENLKK